MKSNKSVFYATLFIIISFILIIVSIFFKFEARWVNLLFTFIPVIVAYGQFMIENYEGTFLLWNKLKMKIKNPTLEWIKTATYEMDSELHKTELINFLSWLIEENDYSRIINERPTKQPSQNNNLILKFGISDITFTILGNNKVKIDCKAHLSYRESNQQLEKTFEYILRKFLQFCIYDHKSESYSIRVKFPNENPFFGLYVKQIQVAEKVNFLLKYRVKDVSYVVSNRSIEATTNCKEALEEATKDIFVLSDS